MCAQFAVLSVSSSWTAYAGAWGLTQAERPAGDLIESRIEGLLMVLSATDQEAASCAPSTTAISIQRENIQHTAHKLCKRHFIMH